ncbi:two-component sensor histidine kinase [Cellulomonas sp. WB94]|uniref:sensor histidine kinase n=1 Tax=Cellulomonas sp. WB94 TaxID=2173174 RepID=UPI000D56DA02|nr:HAMP domain-containing sensor histidine kinase [Cellulomonas sp. WB94]PVU81996.1 two-component sensor histidine kinase [Cellulomonas sp. WB94]
MPAGDVPTRSNRRQHGRGWRGWSLRLRLTVLTAVLLCVTLVAGAVALTSVLSRSRVAALDGIARDRAVTIAALATDDRLPEALPVAEPREIAQLLDASGLVIASSPNASRTLPVLVSSELAALRSKAGDEVLVTTAATTYDDEARVAVRATTYRGAPVTVVATVPLAEVRGLLGALRVSLVVVVPLLTALLAWVIWMVLGRALLPVEQMRRAAAQVARTGGPGSLPVRDADDELGALARTLNEMLDRLEDAAARQRTFTADAAHELRSPLAAVRASIDVARAHPAAYSTAELAEDLKGEVLRMQALVDDLLLLARVGSAPVVRSPIDLGRLAHDAVGAARPVDGVDVGVAGSGVALGDPAAIGRVVRNLVDNALRHASTRVLVTVDDGAVTVEDDGHGVPEEDRQRVFERFVRLDEARERDSGGSGLGLAIAREVAREQGGDVTLAPSALGGLRAALRLPVDAAPGPGGRDPGP